MVVLSGEVGVVLQLGTDGVSIEEFALILDDLIHQYSEKRIKESLGGLSPLDYRRKIGLSG